MAFLLDGKNQMDPINRNLESRRWTLMAKKLAGETSQDELIELEGLVQKIQNAHYVIEILAFWWEISERSGKEQAEQAVADLLSQLEKENEMFRPKKKEGLIIYALLKLIIIFSYGRSRIPELYSSAVRLKKARTSRKIVPYRPLSAA